MIDIDIISHTNLQFTLNYHYKPYKLDSNTLLTVYIVALLTWRPLLLLNIM